MNPKLRVFLADDHAVVRAGLKALVATEEDMEVVGEAGDGQKALTAITELGPDVAVVDISMPGLDGGRLTEAINKSCPDVRVVALTVHEDKGYLRQLLRAGAKAYVLKRSAAEDLIGAIRVVALGEMYLDPLMSQAAAGSIVESPDGGGVATLSRVLSARETEVARLIAQGYSNKEIAARLDISVKTVETHKARIMEKLKITTRAQLVRMAVHEGWLGSDSAA
jgi:DNA-binding NarL/FixJ family response regulator